MIRVATVSRQLSSDRVANTTFTVTVYAADQYMNWYDPTDNIGVRRVSGWKLPTPMTCIRHRPIVRRNHQFLREYVSGFHPDHLSEDPGRHDNLLR